MRIFDVFPYWKEYNHVRIRTALWSRYPVNMIAAVGSHTYAGGPITYTDPIRDGSADSWVHTTQVPLGHISDVWEREKAQRDALIIPTRARASRGDLVILSDADEIIDPRAIPTIIKACTEHGPVSLEMVLLYYGLDFCAEYPWVHAKAFLFEDMPDSLDELRTSYCPSVAHSGWHISWQGGIDMVKEKAVSFSHTEYATPEGLEQIERGYNEHLNPFGVPLIPFDRYKLPAVVHKYM